MTGTGDYWRSRLGRFTILTRLVLIVFFAVVAAIASLMITDVLRRVAEPSDRIGLIVFLCIPFYYLLLMSLFSARGFLSSMRKKRRLRLKLAGMPRDADDPAVKGSAAWKYLSTAGRMIPNVSSSWAAGLGGRLAGRDDLAWKQLAGANQDARLATGESFELLLLMEKGSLNFHSGEIPGIGSWFAAPRELLAGLNGEEALVPVVHELFHREIGEYRARRFADKLRFAGAFSTFFVILYSFIAIYFARLPAKKMPADFTVYILTLLALWILFKVCSGIGAYMFFPAGSCVAADVSAAHAVSSPLIVAEAIRKTLHYSADSGFDFWSSFAYPASRFMFVPVMKFKSARSDLERRILALRRITESGRGAALPEIEKMNAHIERIAAEAGEDYAALRRKRPVAPRVAALIGYAVLAANFIVILLVSSG